MTKYNDIMDIETNHSVFSSAASLGGITIRDVPHTYHLADTPELQQQLFKLLESQTAFCFDIETTSLDPRDAAIVGAQQVSAQLIQHFGDKVYRTVIPRNVRLAEAPSHGVPILSFDKSSKGAQAYLALAGEMLNREQPTAEEG